MEGKNYLIRLQRKKKKRINCENCYDLANDFTRTIKET